MARWPGPGVDPGSGAENPYLDLTIVMIATKMTASLGLHRVGRPIGGRPEAGAHVCMEEIGA